MSPGQNHFRKSSLIVRTLIQLVRFAWIAQQISEENIRQGVIGVDQVDFAFSYDGQDILRPFRMKSASCGMKFSP